MPHEISSDENEEEAVNNYSIRQQSNRSNLVPTTSQPPIQQQQPQNNTGNTGQMTPAQMQMAWTSILNRALSTLNFTPPSAVQHLIRQYSEANNDAGTNNDDGNPHPPLLRRQPTNTQQVEENAGPTLAEILYGPQRQNFSTSAVNFVPQRQNLPEESTAEQISLNIADYGEEPPNAHVQNPAEGFGEWEIDHIDGGNENVEANEREDDNENAEGFVRTLRTQMQSSKVLVSHLLKIQSKLKFTVLILLGSLLCTLFVAGYALIEYIYENIESITFTASLFACTNRFDSGAFKSLVEGNGRWWFLAIRIFIRQFFILYGLGQYVFVFPTLIYTFPNSPHSFWKTTYIVYLSAVFIKDCAMTLKLLVFLLPKFKSKKGRLYQCIEYTSILYQFTVPFLHWNIYLGKLWCTIVYAGIKILFLLPLIFFWLLTTINIFRGLHKFGKIPTKKECQERENCTICFSDFQKPIKLKCSHIFCTECIEKWLERKSNCPFCRATIDEAVEDKKYRDGDTMDTITF